MLNTDYVVGMPTLKNRFIVSTGILKVVSLKLLVPILRNPNEIVLSSIGNPEH